MIETRTLLDDIKAEISATGGRYKLAAIIVRENPDIFNYSDKAKIKRGLNGIERTRRHRRKKPYAPKSMRNRKWSDEHILYLRKFYGVTKTGKLAKQLGRTGAACVLKFLAVATAEEKQWVVENGFYAGKSQLNKNK